MSNTTKVESATFAGTVIIGEEGRDVAATVDVVESATIKVDFYAAGVYSKPWVAVVAEYEGERIVYRITEDQLAEIVHQFDDKLQARNVDVDEAPAKLLGIVK